MTREPESDRRARQLRVAGCIVIAGVPVSKVGSQYLTKDQIAELLRHGGAFSGPAEAGVWLPLSAREQLWNQVAAIAENVIDIGDVADDVLDLFLGGTP